jgi:hypothetical protein
MTFNNQFFDYLRHFEGARTIRDLHDNPEARPIIGLRHDIDYSIDIALDAAYWEQKIGVSATYYVLHTADYWKDTDLIDKCLQLQDYGHEVGLHINVLAEWARGAISDPADRLAHLLTFLRAGGVKVTGVAAHGDPLCYEQGFINYWCFRELRPEDPVATEHMRTAEGVRDPSGARGVSYPRDGALKRSDGAVFPLWSLSLLDFGLDYHAWHVPFDRYYSDSGGGWYRSPDPLQEDFGSVRSQVLMHPIHWLGPKRAYFFLSTARSGSKWLSEVLEAATSLTSRHEYILNQEFFDGRTAEKRTGHDFASLAQNHREVTRLIADAWDRVERQPNDYAEINVYLEAFIETILTFFGNAVLIHLHRDPRAVVRSIMNRHWYDTPLDDRHRRVDTPKWDSLGQFEKACHYVRDVNERLVTACSTRLCFERMTTDVEYLAETLAKLGIPLHLRLARRYIGKVVNANSESDFPTIEEWSIDQRQKFDEICGPVSAQLGYDRPTARPINTDRRYVKNWISRLARRFPHNLLPIRETVPIILSEGPVSERSAKSWGLRAAAPEHANPNGAGILVRVDRSRGNAYVTFGGSSWEVLAFRKKGLSGWSMHGHRYVEGRISVDIVGQGRIAVFALSYGRYGKRIGKRSLAVIHPGQSTRRFAFTPRGDTRRIDIALHISRYNGPETFRIRELDLRLVPFPGDDLAGKPACARSSND